MVKKNMQMLNLEETARLLHVHPNTLRRWTTDHKFPAYRICKRGDLRFSEHEVLEWIKGRALLG